MTTLILNPEGGSLYHEDRNVDPEQIGSTPSSETCFDGLRERTLKKSGHDFFGPSSERKQTVMLSAFMPTTRIFGVPEREDSLELIRTTGVAPYRIWGHDQPWHMTNDRQNLYGSVPYLMGLDEASAEGFLFVNSA